jgi:hypothetical protein
MTSGPASILGGLVLSGDLVEVQLFLIDPWQNPAVNENEAIRIASRKGYADILSYLLSFKDDVDPTARNNEAIRVAIANGHLKVEQITFLHVNVLKITEIHVFPSTFLKITEIHVFRQY